MKYVLKLIIIIKAITKRTINGLISCKQILHNKIWVNYKTFITKLVRKVLVKIIKCVNLKFNYTNKIFYDKPQIKTVNGNHNKIFKIPLKFVINLL